MTLTLAPTLLSGRRKTAALPPLVNGLGNPVNPGVPSHRLVLRVNSNNFEVLVNTVLVDPVRVQDAQVGALSANTFLSGGTERALVLEVVNTLANGLAEGGTFGDGLLAVTTANSDTVDNKALLGLVAETVGFVGAGRARGSVDYVELTVLPASVGVAKEVSGGNMVSGVVEKGKGESLTIATTNLSRLV